MKLPGNLELGVQQLSTVDPGKPMQVANAEVRGAEAMAGTLAKFGDVATDIYKRDASGERNSKKAKYHIEEAALREELLANPYETLPDGTVRSRAPDIVTQYEEREAALRDSVLGGTENALAKNQLGRDLETSNAVTRTAVQATAAQWANEAAFMKNDAAFTASVQNKQWSEAERITVEMTATGQINEKQANDKLTSIDNARTYYDYSDSIEANPYVNAEDSLTTIDEINTRTNISDKQKSVLVEKSYKRQEEMFNTMLRGKIENPVEGQSGGATSEFGNRAYSDGVGADMGGLAFGRFQIREITFMSPDALGLPDEASKRRLISSLNATQREYALKAEKNKVNMQEVRACETAVRGTRQLSQKDIKGATDTVLNRGEGRDVKAFNCAHDYYTADLQPGTLEWEQAGPAREIRTQGFMAETSKNWFTAAFSNAGTPAGAQAFGSAVTMMKRLQSEPNGRRAFSFLSDKTKILAEEAMALQDAGVLTADSISMLTTGLEVNTPSEQQANLTQYKSTTYVELESVLTDALEERMPFGEIMADAVVPPGMAADYNTILEPLIKRFGDKPAVYKTALDSLLNTWSGSDRDQRFAWTPNDKGYRKNAPETVYADQAPNPEKLSIALETSYNEIMEAYDLDDTEYEVGEATMVQGKNVFFIRKRGAVAPALDKDGVPITWAFEYSQSTEAKLELLDERMKKREAENTQRTEQLEANLGETIPETIGRVGGQALTVGVRGSIDAAYNFTEYAGDAYGAVGGGIVKGAKAVGGFAGDKYKGVKRAYRTSRIDARGGDGLLDQSRRDALKELAVEQELTEEQYQKIRAKIIKEGKTL